VLVVVAANLRECERDTSPRLRSCAVGSVHNKYSGSSPLPTDVKPPRLDRRTLPGEDQNGVWASTSRESPALPRVPPSFGIQLQFIQPTANVMPTVIDSGDCCTLTTRVGKRPSQTDHDVLGRCRLDDSSQRGDNRSGFRLAARRGVGNVIAASTTKRSPVRSKWVAGELLNDELMHQ
jgi:hypothetical protein